MTFIIQIIYGNITLEKFEELLVKLFTLALNQPKPLDDLIY